MKMDVDGGKLEPEEIRKLFVGGLDYNTIDETLESHFEQWGEIVDCEIVKQSNEKKSRGFGFVTFKCAKMVDDVQAARPHIIDGKEVVTKRAALKKDSGKSEASVKVKKLCVRSLKDDVEEEDLKQYFSEYGNVITTTIVVDKLTGKTKGYGYVEFDDYDPVDKAVLQKHTIKGQHAEVEKAFTKQEKKTINRKNKFHTVRCGQKSRLRKLAKMATELNLSKKEYHAMKRKMRKEFVEQKKRNFKRNKINSFGHGQSSGSYIPNSDNGIGSSGYEGPYSGGAY